MFAGARWHILLGSAREGSSSNGPFYTRFTMVVHCVICGRTVQEGVLLRDGLMG